MGFPGHLLSGYCDLIDLRGYVLPSAKIDVREFHSKGVGGVPQETQPLVGTEGRPEARPVVLWEPLFPLCIQSTHSVSACACLPLLVLLLYSHLILVHKSLILPMGRRSYSHPCSHGSRDPARMGTFLILHPCAKPCPHLNRWSLFSFDNPELFVKTDQLFAPAAAG